MKAIVHRNHGSIQVTLSETNAACGRRIVRLRDGWIEDATGGQGAS